ncbi:Uncharacterised protein [Mycobacteroides abscessus subsp. abscessus]|nr:Uncharacterised protein [Mycobacteroides abscessus subsp. abscessus]
MLSSHSYLPVMGGVDVMPSARSAAPRSATGSLNVTTTGCAIPTRLSGIGAMDLTLISSGRLTAVVSTPTTCPASAASTTDTATTM